MLPVSDFSDEKKLLPEGNYRLDSNTEVGESIDDDDNDDGELGVWLEKLKEGEVTENYIFVSLGQYSRMKLAGQIFEYDDSTGLWTKQVSDVLDSQYLESTAGD